MQKEGEMKWIDVNDKLPHDGQIVLVQTTMDNAYWADDKIDRHCVCQFRVGRTNDEVRASGISKFADQDGNNLVPYRWEYGIGSFFGQDVSYWAAIIDTDGNEI